MERATITRPIHRHMRPTGGRSGELEQIRTQTKKDRKRWAHTNSSRKSAEAAQKEAERIAGLDMESLQRIREIYTENRNRIEQEKLQYDTISNRNRLTG